MRLTRWLIHLATAAALAAVSAGIGRWISEPSGLASALALLVAAVAVAVCVARLYGPDGPAALAWREASPAQAPQTPAERHRERVTARASPPVLWAPDDSADFRNRED